jgi:hypothetical protein
MDTMEKMMSKNIYKDYDSVRIVSKDLDLTVEKLVDSEWVYVRCFNRMSDDYAITNAVNCAKELFKREFADILV